MLATLGPAVVLTSLGLATPAAASLELVDPASAGRPAEAEEAAALAVFQAHHRAVDQLQAKNASRAQLEAKIDELLDYETLAVETLGGAKRHAETCASACDEFRDLLSQLIRHNYYRMLQKAKGRPIEYTGRVTSNRSGKVKIRTKVSIRDDGPRHKREVDVAYVLERGSTGGWQVVDIVTETVSLKKTYRYEFNKIRKKKGAEGGITGIISSLRSKIAELRSAHAAKKG